MKSDNEEGDAAFRFIPCESQHRGHLDICCTLDTRAKARYGLGKAEATWSCCSIRQVRPHGTHGTEARDPATEVEAAGFWYRSDPRCPRNPAGTVYAKR